MLDFFKTKHTDIVFDVLANVGFWGEDSTKIDGLYKKVEAYFDDIKSLGISKAMEKLLDE